MMETIEKVGQLLTAAQDVFVAAQGWKQDSVTLAEQNAALQALNAQLDALIAQAQGLLSGAG